MNRKGSGTIIISALLIFAAFTIAVKDVSAAISPDLGAAGTYGVLAGSIVTNTGLTTIGADVGVSPSIGVPPHVTGFPPGIVGPPGTIHDADLNAFAAQAANTAAFTSLDQGPCTSPYVFGSGVMDLAGANLVPGVYCADAFTLSGTLTLSGSGVWIFKSASTLITSGTANVVGGDPCNVWWRVVSSATLGTYTQLIGNILALTDITLRTGARLNGRALAQTGQVVLEANSVTVAICVPLTTVTTSLTTTLETTITTTTPPLTTILTTTIATLTTIFTTITIFPPQITVAVGGEILPVDTSQLLGFVAIWIATAAIGLAVMYKRRIQ